VIPLLIPVLRRFGIDPTWYGVIFITALAIGQTTPPVGVNLFTAANLAGSDVDSISRRIFPYVAVNIAGLVILSLIPALSLYLPRHLGLLQ
jgi:C4-dicarboxylate transporter DctM subunit